MRLNWKDLYVLFLCQFWVISSVADARVVAEVFVILVGKIDALCQVSAVADMTVHGQIMFSC